MGPWVHDLDPIIGTVFGVHLWWYGLSYSLGFLNAHLSFMRRRAELGLSTREVYELSLLLSTGVLVGGRLIVVNNEWAFYRDHLDLLPAVWIGGMATHGLIIGGFAGVALFCLLRRKPLLVMLDAMAIPAALILCVGRLGNFIDGEIVGRVTTVPWAVKFPDAEGFRHPVVLYDGLKNLLIVPVLMRARTRRAARGPGRPVPVPLRVPAHLHRLLPRIPAHAARPAVGPDDEPAHVGGGDRTHHPQPAPPDGQADDAGCVGEAWRPLVAARAVRGHCPGIAGDCQ
jgi:phosphatidylglycerol:prolipoprotein diacylglycerol transferase